MRRPQTINIDDSDLEAMFADPIWAGKFPPLLSVKTAAELANVSQATIYDWSSRGLLDSCARKQGKRLRIVRGRFVQFLLGVGSSRNEPNKMNPINNRRHNFVSNAGLHHGEAETIAVNQIENAFLGCRHLEPKHNPNLAPIDVQGENHER